MAKALFSEFRGMGEVAQRTRLLLQRRWTARSLTAQQHAQLDTTLRHLAAVREGFQLSLRHGAAAPDEIRAIVRYTLHTIDWDFLGELGWYLEQGEQLARLGDQLVAFAHASVALALLPRLPASQISHPMSSHYRDLPIPQRPGEWLERIEELEAVLTDLQWERAPSPTSPALRRTHAYFDASAWLIHAHLRRFEGDSPQGQEHE